MVEEEYDFTTFNYDDFSGTAVEEESPAAPPPPPPAPEAQFEEPVHQASQFGVMVIVVDDDQSVRDYLAAQLGGGIDSVATLIEVESMMAGDAMVVLLGPSCSGPADLALVERWARTHPEVGAVLVSGELTTPLLHSAMRAGVKDVLSAPIDQMQLTETVGRVGDGLSSASAPVTPMPGYPSGEQVLLEDGEVGRSIAVFSTKGGSGKSVVATNLATSLALSSDKPVILIDGHLQFGDVGVMLKLQPQHTVIDATSQMVKLDGAMLTQLMTIHEESGLLVLPAPHEPTFADQITGQDMVDLVDLAKSVAGHVIIDLPAVFNDVVLGLVETVDDLILVAGLDIPNIKNVKIGLSTLAMLNVDKSKIHLVLNRADSKVKLDVGEVEKTLQISAVAHIPSDVVVPISVNKGSPVVLSANRSGVAKALEQLSARFLDASAGPIEVKQSSKKRRFFG